MNKSEDVGLASSLPNDDELTRKEMPRLHFLFGFDGLHQLLCRSIFYSLGPLAIRGDLNVP
jgi:hypothetical protein